MAAVLFFVVVLFIANVKSSGIFGVMAFLLLLLAWSLAGPSTAAAASEKVQLVLDYVRAGETNACLIASFESAGDDIAIVRFSSVGDSAVPEHVDIDVPSIHGKCLRPGATLLVHHDASVNELLSEYGLEKHKDTVLVDWAATEAHQAKDDQAYR